VGEPILNYENSEWLGQFRRTKRRAPTVLHIGNIANNAYLNATLLNEAGFDCDVISHGYYHAMGAPEWEDAELRKMPADMFNPNWAKITPADFKRPRWFAQGPQRLCLDYLLAKRSESPKSVVDDLWTELSLSNRTFRKPLTSLKAIILLMAAKTARLKRIIERSQANPFRLARNVMRNVFALLNRVLRDLEKLIAPKWPGARAGFRYLKNLSDRLSRAISLLLTPGRLLAALEKSFQKVSTAETKRKEDSFRKLSEVYSREFPQRSDLIEASDVLPVGSLYGKWEKLLQKYDFIIGYATDGIYPLLCNQKYFAFEHGTIRDMPYEETQRGRFCALTYRLAAHCFVTNSDCVKSAEYLSPGRFSTINHPYDEDRPIRVSRDEKLRAGLCRELNCSHLIFHPARQDWVPGTGYADKANDKFWKAMRLLREQGVDVGVIATNWGSNIADSKKLIKTLGIEAHVKWVPALASYAFEKMFAQVDLVADQFFLGAFGGIVPKALASSRVVVTYLKLGDLEGIYDEPPPVLVANTEFKIADQIKEVLANDELRRDLECRGRDWVEQYHGKRELINREVAVFRKSLGDSPGD
jgi:glycosyltransferase involved in cell wall biosynthesis